MRKISLVFVCVMMLSLFAGCRSRDNENRIENVDEISVTEPSLLNSSEYIEQDQETLSEEIPEDMSFEDALGIIGEKNRQVNREETKGQEQEANVSEPEEENNTPSDSSESQKPAEDYVDNPLPEDDTPIG